MTSEHNVSDEIDMNPVTMKGYHYLVAVAGSKKLTLDDVLQPHLFERKELPSRNDVITLEKVWCCKGGLLTERGDSDNKIKDICLSYSLLKILYLRCAAFALPVEAQPKARKLILEGLISNSDSDRAFRVIEVELKLLSELIYTKYPLYAMPIFAGLRVLEFILLLVVCSLYASYMSKYADSLECVEVAKVRGFNLAVLVTYVLLGMIVFADISQVWMIFSSEWVKAALIFNYVANKYCLNNIIAETLILKVCKPWFSKPWARELGQYSLLKSRCYGAETWILTIVRAICSGKNWDWQRESKAVHLSIEVKVAVLDYLRKHGINLENWRRSLKSNHVYEMLPGVCKSKHVAEDILVWHIAPSYCLCKSLVSRKNKKNSAITENLSNYLAYLVAFAPRLLPGPHFEPQFHFRSVMKEANKAFKVCTKAEDKIYVLDKLAKKQDQTEKQDQTVIVRGARLGKSLLQLGEHRVWEILAEFWSEMVLRAATSSEVRAHLEKLANGGEFITHLWVLLYYACYSADHPTEPSELAWDDMASTVSCSC